MEEALGVLLRQKKVLKRAMAKNTILYHVPLVGYLSTAADDNESMIEANKTLDSILGQLREATQTLDSY